MSGRHEAPPAGSGAREATASPYAGRHRAEVDEDGEQCIYCLRFCYLPGYGCLHCGRGLSGDVLNEPDDPDRCPSCGHLYDAGCDDLCCYDSHDEAITDV